MINALATGSESQQIKRMMKNMPLCSLAQLQPLMMKYEVISFDVFDTVVRRRQVFRPVDVFMRVGEKVAGDLGVTPQIFAELRVRAEKEARIRALALGREEITSAEIYVALRSLLRTKGIVTVAEADFQHINNIERTEELSLVEAVPGVPELVEKLIAANKRVFFVSDYYDDEDFVADVLSRCGYNSYEALFVSSTVGLTKDRGTIYPYIAAELGIRAEDMLHVGDNLHSDVNRATEMGHHAIRVNRPMTDYLQRIRLPPNYFSNPASSALLHHVATTVYGETFAERASNSMPEFERLAHEVLGPLLVGFCRWILERQARDRHDHLFFCSRDGILPKQIFDACRLGSESKVTTTYLCVSRQVIYRAIAALPDTNVEAHFCQNWSSLTPGNALQRWGLEPADHLESLRKVDFARYDQRISMDDKEGLNQLKELYAMVADDIAEANKPFLARLLSYLDQSGLLTAKRPCMVDIGWHGTLQRGLQQIIDSIHGNTKLHGCYLGLFLPLGIAEKQAMQGYLFNFDGSELAKAVRACPSLVEMLYTAEHGTTKDYQAFDTGIVPVFEENTADFDQFNGVIRPVQTAALSFAISYMSKLDNQLLGCIDPTAAFAAFHRLLKQPTDAQYKSLGSLEIAANFGESAQRIRLSEIMPNGYRPWVFR